MGNGFNCAVICRRCSVTESSGFYLYYPGAVDRRNILAGVVPQAASGNSEIK